MSASHYEQNSDEIQAGPVRCFITRIEKELNLDRSELMKNPNVHQIFAQATQICKLFSSSPELERTTARLMKPTQDAESVRLQKQDLKIWRSTGPAAVQQELFTTLLMREVAKHDASHSQK